MNGVVYLGYWFLGNISIRYHISSEGRREAFTTLSMGVEYDLLDAVN